MVLGLIGGVAKTGFKMATGGPVARGALGAGIGAGAGFFGTDYNNAGSTMGSMLQGSIWGAAGGALGPMAAKGILKGLPQITGTGLYAASSLGGTAFKAGRFAFEHPIVTAGAVGGTIGAGALMNRSDQFTSPTLSGVTMNARYNQQQAAAAQLQMSGISPSGMMGSAPQMMGSVNRVMQGSTTGLVQGLHRGRH